MGWDVEVLIADSRLVILPYNFSSQLLAIDISASNQRDTWYRSGYLSSLVNLDGNDFFGDTYKLGFGRQLIEVPYSNYQLRFAPQDWMRNINIKIRQLPITSIQSLTRNMYIINSEQQPPKTGDPIYSNVTPNAFNSATPVFTIAAPRSRRSALITNRTSSTVFIKEGTAASNPTLIVGDPFVSIATNASYVVEDYSGEIVGLMQKAFSAGGKIFVKELPYINSDS
jgi:hypothetical protein